MVRLFRWWCAFKNIRRYISGEIFEVFMEAGCQFFGFAIVFFWIGPGAARIEHFRGYAWALFRHLQPEDGINPIRYFIQLPRERRAGHCPGVGKFDALAFAERPSGPTRVDQPDIRTMGLDALP